ncbi:MAG TPA: signal peptidase I [Promineifilum sp.]|nr:signal peptidase I [Promineifilum sp.]HRO25266.1 signal peptidase I [Promineifilum sp.]HRO89830.1 signal peptidase I [Promineifilum sp.]HRQ14652.1 signal peptidase I [Promineifilum sp.]
MPTDSKPPTPPAVLDAALQSWGNAGRQIVFPMSGQSMEPFLKAGDQLLITHGREHIRVGTLVAYRQDDKLIVHRLLHVFDRSREPMMLLRGDNNNYPDLLIPLDRLIGRVSAVRRGDRSYTLETPLWRGASRLIAACYRWPITLGQWAGAARRRLFPNRPVSDFGRSYRLSLRVFTIPARFLTFMLWKFARYDRI